MGVGGIAHNMDVHTDNKQPQGGSDNDSGEIRRDMCLGEAIDRHCTDKLCWRKHNAKSIEQYKAALGTKCWGKQKRW